MFPSLNLATVPQVDMQTALPLCQEAGFTGVGLWVDPVRALGVGETCKMLSHLGLRVSSLCPSGSFSDNGRGGLQKAIDETKAKIDLARDLNADCLCILPGTFSGPRVDHAGARTLAREGLEAVLPHAREAGVTVAIEPLHPMNLVTNSIVNTVHEALQWAQDLGASLFIDTYHVWWDPRLEEDLKQATGKIAGFHINDWKRETQDLVLDRTLPGEGVIHLPEIIEWVSATGYDGAAEVEIFSTELAQLPARELIEACRASLQKLGI